MALIAAQVLDRASVILNDTGNISYPREELLDWLNDARRVMASIRTDLYAVVEDVELAAGARQGLPADGYRLIDVTYNDDGTPITLVRRETMGLLGLGVANAASTRVKHYMFDERSPRAFRVWPPAAAGTVVEMVYARLPEPVTLEGTLLESEELYSALLVDYVVARAYMKDTEFVANQQRAAAHLDHFMSVLGSGRERDFSASPNSNEGGQPSRAGQ